MTYVELDSISDPLAAGLAALGVQPGQAVAVQLPNVPQFLVAYFGILKAGAVVVPLNVLLKARELTHCLATSQARALITWGPMSDEAVKAAADAGVPDVFAVGPQPDTSSITPFAELLRQASPQRPIAAREPVDTAESELIAYCRDWLAAYKYPRLMEIRASLPKTETGKIAKLELRR
jgi:long-chain acyl-CoA synthetase